MSIQDTKCTIAELAVTEMNGRTYGRNSILRTIKKLNIEPKGISDSKGRGLLYSLKEVSDGLLQCVKAKDSIGENTGLANLKAAKIKEEIHRLKQEKERAELEIQELKQHLIDADEVRNFLMLRFGTETALLRRILFVNAPVELSGVEIAKARKICEGYYNSIQDLLTETLLLWNNRNLDTETPIPEAIQKVIDRLNESLKNA